MFDSLSEKLQRVFKNLRGEGKLTAENMDAALREIRVALLEADVHFRVVKQLIESSKRRRWDRKSFPSFAWPASHQNCPRGTGSGYSARIRLSSDLRNEPPRS